MKQNPITVKDICRAAFVGALALTQNIIPTQSSSVFASNINEGLRNLTATTHNDWDQDTNLVTHNNLRGTDIDANVTCTFNVNKDVKKDLCQGYLYWCTPLQCTVTGTYAHTLKLAYRIQHTTSHAKDDDTCGTSCKQIIQSCLKNTETFEQVIRSLISRWRQTDSPFENDDSIIEKTANTWHDVAVSMKLQYFLNASIVCL